MTSHRGQPVVAAGAPLSDSRGVIVMLHGRNASPANILELVPTLSRPAFACLAPSAPGKTWYPHSFLTEIAKNEPELSSSLSAIDALVSDLVAQGIRQDHIVLLGFSQGACLAAEFAVRHAGRYGGLIVFSGGLIGPPGATWQNDGSFGGTPVFLGCSDVDAHIPKARVDESALVFERMGAAVTKRIYPGMGHLINDDEIAQAQGVLDLVPIGRH